MKIRKAAGIPARASSHHRPEAAMMSGPTTPPERLRGTLSVPAKTLSGPGPSNCPQRVLEASALPLLGHLHSEFVQIMDDIKVGIQYAFQTSNEWTLALSGSGHAGMETAALNLLERGEVVLVGVNGLWGERFSNLAERQGAEVSRIEKPMGQIFSLQEIEEGLQKHKPALLFLTHGESSGGTLQSLEGVGALCHRYNCLLLVDTVAAMGGAPLYMDAWEIDVLYSGSQKVLGAPPGTSPISFSERARQKVLNRKAKVPSFYFDMVELANYWGADEGPRRYHHTAPISNMYALREALSLLAEEGLERSWKRHKDSAQILHEGLERMGLQLLVEDKSIRLPCVTTIKVPDGVNWKAVADYAMKNHLVEISGGLGRLAGKVWRIGTMGMNAQPDAVCHILSAFEDSLKHTHGKFSAKL